MKLKMIMIVEEILEVVCRVEVFGTRQQAGLMWTHLVAKTFPFLRVKFATIDHRDQTISEDVIT